MLTFYFSFLMASCLRIFAWFVALCHIFCGMLNSCWIVQLDFIHGYLELLFNSIGKDPTPPTVCYPLVGFHYVFTWTRVEHAALGDHRFGPLAPKQISILARSLSITFQFFCFANKTIICHLAFAFQSVYTN